jgi:hypothetical protein
MSRKSLLATGSLLVGWAIDMSGIQTGPLAAVLMVFGLAYLPCGQNLIIVRSLFRGHYPPSWKSFWTDLRKGCSKTKEASTDESRWGERDTSHTAITGPCQAEI